MIPKKIHYCWFGRGEKPKLAKRCIASWKKYCPDYEIIEWNEDNFDLSQNQYLDMCYRQKKYAFLSDYIRLLVIEQYGGIYFDTDVEICRSIDFLRTNTSYIGFETSEYVNTGLGFGSVPHGLMVQMLLKEYEPLLSGDKGTIGCPILNTKALIPLGLICNGSFQKLGDSIAVYPCDWFNPYDDATGILSKTENTVSIHWFSKSWMSKKTVFRSYLSKPLHRFQKLILGDK